MKLNQMVFSFNNLPDMDDEMNDNVNDDDKYKKYKDMSIQELKK